METPRTKTHWRLGGDWDPVGPREDGIDKFAGQRSVEGKGKGGSVRSTNCGYKEATLNI